MHAHTACTKLTLSWPVIKGGWGTVAISAAMYACMTVPWPNLLHLCSSYAAWWGPVAISAAMYSCLIVPWTVLLHLCSSFTALPIYPVWERKISGLNWWCHENNPELPWKLAFSSSYSESFTRWISSSQSSCRGKSNHIWATSLRYESTHTLTHMWYADKQAFFTAGQSRLVMKCRVGNRKYH